MLQQPHAPQPAETRLAALDRYFKLSLYLLLLTSVLALVSTGKLDLISIIVAPAALLAKGYRWLHGHKPEISARAATWLVILYFVFFPLDLWWFSRSFAGGAQSPALFAALIATVHLMLFAMMVRLFSAATTRDYLFLAMLSFTTILSAAILTVDTVFLGFFLVFMILAISTFMALEMRSSAEAAATAPLEPGTQAARRLRTALSATAGVLAVSALAIGAVIFFLLPRFSAGYLSSYNLQPTLISGFSDDVELGEIGEIKKSSTIVMRIQIEGDPAAAEAMHWRGVVLTNFDGRRWFTDQRSIVTLSPNSDGWFPLPQTEGENQRRTTRLLYSVLLEPIATNSLFYADEPSATRGSFFGQDSSQLLRRSYLAVDSTGSIFNPFHNFARMRYEGLSRMPENPPADLRAASTDYPDSYRATYLQLPPLDPRIPALAQQITANLSNPFDKASAIAAYLRTHYAYSLDLSGTPPTADPLPYFLFTRRAGHCEYFASAMTVMVRSLGIPARYINGFLPGEFNDVGGDYVIRASDAHSWVEVYFPGYGWITFDPTPPAADSPRNWSARLGEYWDWFQLTWNDWIINYDFAHQFQLAQNLERTSRSWTEQLRARWDAAKWAAMQRMLKAQSRFVQWPHHAALAAALSVFLLALIVLGPARKRLRTAWRLRTGRGELNPHLATLHYQKMLRLLERRGLRKTPGQTPREFATSIGPTEIAAPVAQLTALYQASRFGNQGTQIEQMFPLLRAIRDALRPTRRAPQ
jgi:transglutaminase-like putative cysteine protease